VLPLSAGGSAPGEEILFERGEMGSFVSSALEKLEQVRVRCLTLQPRKELEEKKTLLSILNARLLKGVERTKP
jgi:hypothetical protein